MLAVALWPETLEVDVAPVVRGPLVVTVEEEGRTRVRDRFVVSAPVTGRVRRIELEPGDRVRRGAVVARLQPEPPPLLDARTRAEAQAAVESARAALGRARAEEQRAAAALAQADRELARSRRLVDAGVLPAQEADLRETDARLAREANEAAAFAVRAAAAELARAEARLAPSSPRQAGAAVAVTAPADGVILRRLRESESLVPAGEPLVEIGDPADLEIVVDLLSTDAVRIREGSRALVEQSGQAPALEAIVRRIEPSGFTKVSALGVEEQRVNVILELPGPAGGEDLVLGDAYRVDVRIVVWEAADVLKLPTSALVRDGEQWAVFLVEAGRARRTLVELGQQNGREAEVLAGLAEGARVVIHPSDALTDGSRVRE
ncbi:MAG: efflux RND transporter periplasmic adaptor subunit [Acidobacteria bacterium]|nr:efflux RND transporter periplasmic adaptor subunit [Acidobacteriota bacterium]